MKHEPNPDNGRTSGARSQREDAGGDRLARRQLLGSLGALTGAAAIAAGPLAPGAAASSNDNDMVGPNSPKDRRNAVAKLRKQIAEKNRKQPFGNLDNNGDEDLYDSKIGSYSKGLPHDTNGEVDPDAYAALLEALHQGKPALFEQIPLGCPTPAQQRKLVNPQAGLAFDTEGLDACQFDMPPAPTLASAETAGEAVEHYWQAQLRDVHFSDYGSSGMAAAAMAELSTLTDFRGPKVSNAVTAATLFRDVLPGATAGPYVSQFLLKAVPFGAVNIEQKMRTLLAATDHVTAVQTWLDIQDGCKPTTGASFDTVRRYIRNGRDLSQWVHIDVLYQAYFHAALILMTPPDTGDLVTGGGIGCPLDPGNPYLSSSTQDGFGTFGGPYFMTILTEVATRALKAVWFQKWFLSRRLRPEAYGGLVHRAIANGATLPLHSDVLDSTAAANVFSANGTYLLPQAFPEGSPLHPSYGAGHATVAGACVTILKALFVENVVVPSPVVASSDGLTIQPYLGSDADSLTVGGELNKLASNVATGRNIAGVHWRSDAYWSLRLGEQVAISVLEDQRKTYNEDFDGFTFTTFDGDTITV